MKYIVKNSRIHLDRLQNKYTNYKALKITPILDKSLEYKRNWIQHVNRMPHNRVHRVMKHYFPTGRRNHGRPLKRLLDTRPERVNKWPNSTTDMMMMMMTMTMKAASINAIKKIT